MHLKDFEGSFNGRHCCMDKIFKDSGLQSSIQILKHFCYRKTVLQFCVCNFVYPALWTNLKELRGCMYSMRYSGGI